MAKRHPISTHARFKDLTGRRFNRWTVIEFVEFHETGGKSMWRCRCDCGTERVVCGAILAYGSSKSCGCLQRETTSTRSGTHRASNTAEYKVWTGMKSRCYNPNRKSYADYGARGICICGRWLDSFENFLADMGPRPSAAHTIERKNPNGNYEPSNCCWMLRKEQGKNTRKSVRVVFNGSPTTVHELASEHDVSAMALYKRIARGQSVEHAISSLLSKRRALP